MGETFRPQVSVERTYGGMGDRLCADPRSQRRLDVQVRGRSWRPYTGQALEEGLTTDSLVLIMKIFEIILHASGVRFVGFRY